jgi:HSP20 family protein
MRTLIKNNASLFPAIPSLLNDFFGRDWPESTLGNGNRWNSTVPAVNVSETDDRFEIEVAAPGMDRKDFKVELQDNVLTISSERENRDEEKDAQGNYTRREFSYASFQRSFTLPQDAVQGDRITAKYADGILLIAVPKTEKARVKLPKQIAIG